MKLKNKQHSGFQLSVFLSRCWEWTQEAARAKHTSVTEPSRSQVSLWFLHLFPTFLF